MAAVGIHFGTKSCVAVVRDEEAQVLQNYRGEHIIPSCVAFDETTVVVGKRAKYMQYDGFNAVYGIERIIGKKFDEEFIQKQQWPFTVIKGDDGMCEIEVTRCGRKERFRPEEISALVLHEMKLIAEKRLRREVKDAVITVPASFTVSQRVETETAAKIAGLNVIGIINEPTAAAFALDLSTRSKKYVLVYNLERCSFEAAVIEVQGTSYRTKGVAGDLYLGGEDFTINLAKHFAEIIRERREITIVRGTNSWKKLIVQAETAKRELSYEPDIRVGLRFRNDIADEVDANVTKYMFENLNMKLFLKSMECVKEAMKQAQIAKEKIKDVVFVGKSTRIPFLRWVVTNNFPDANIHYSTDHDELTSTVIAQGAAVLAAQLAGFQTRRMPKLNYVETLLCSIGTDVKGGETSFIIEKNSELPAEAVKTYANAVDNQTSIKISICQGEEQKFSRNKFIDTFFVPISPGLAGKIKVDVNFKVDSVGMLLVTAREKVLFAKERRITIINLRHAFRKERINTQRRKLELIIAGKDTSLAAPTSEKEDSQNTDTEEEEVDATASVSEIKVTKSSRDFYESHLKNSRIYTVDQNQEKGKVLLINNEFRGKRKERKGSLLDFKNLENLWKELGFRLVTKQNLTSQQMRSTFIEFAHDSINTSIVVVIVMTHGGNENEKDFIEGENESVIYINDVISYFDIHHSPHLHGIPKIFFFQACRGNERDFGIATDSSVTKHPSRSDTLIVYPSQAGFVSIRHETEGSWLMNAVTNVFMRNAHDTHILDMLTMVNNAVAEKEAMDGRVQISNQETFLRKKLFLFPGWPN